MLYLFYRTICGGQTQNIVFEANILRLDSPADRSAVSWMPASGSDLFFFFGGNRSFLSNCYCCPQDYLLTIMYHCNFFLNIFFLSWLCVALGFTFGCLCFREVPVYLDTVRWSTYDFLKQWKMCVCFFLGWTEEEWEEEEHLSDGRHSHTFAFGLKSIVIYDTTNPNTHAFTQKQPQQQQRQHTHTHIRREKYKIL